VPLATAEAPAPDLSAEELARRYGDAVWRVEATGCGVEATGTAFAIDARTLITNWHVTVVDAAPQLVSRDGETTLQGRVLGWSDQPDVAVIRVDEDLATTVAWTDADDLEEGQPLVALGYPLPATDFTVTRGDITSFQTDDGVRQAIRTDAALDKGNSGGPVLTSRGAVAGVVTEMAPSDGFQLVPLAYTYDHLRETIAELSTGDGVESDCDAAGARPELPDGWGDDLPQDHGPFGYGDDPELDALWDACADGDWAACDELYWSSPVSSDYEAFGASCGDREAAYGTCEYLMDVPDVPVDSDPWPDEPETYGDDADLDRLWDRCSSGDWDACDDLYIQAPFDSRYEDFGNTCGDRIGAGHGSCSWEMHEDPDTYGDDVDLDRLWDRCSSGDGDACDDLYFQAPYGSRYEDFGSTCGDRVGPSHGTCSWEMTG
jgi:hypothetical protein